MSVSGGHETGRDVLPEPESPARPPTSRVTAYALAVIAAVGWAVALTVVWHQNGGDFGRLMTCVAIGVTTLAAIIVVVHNSTVHRIERGFTTALHAAELRSLVRVDALQAGNAELVERIGTLERTTEIVRPHAVGAVYRGRVVDLTEREPARRRRRSRRVKPVGVDAQAIAAVRDIRNRLGEEPS